MKHTLRIYKVNWVGAFWIATIAGDIVLTVRELSMLK